MPRNGMDDSRDRPSRWYLSPAMKWQLRLVARPAHHESGRTSGRGVLSSQPNSYSSRPKRPCGCSSIVAALVPSRARVLAALLISRPVQSMVSMPATRQPSLFARHVIAACAFRKGGPNRLHCCNLLPSLEIATPWRDCWFTLDQLGYAIQGFAQQLKHDPAKAALGCRGRSTVPDAIHFPVNNPTAARRTWPPPKVTVMRRPSSITSRIMPRGQYALRVTGLPRTISADLATSRCEFSGNCSITCAKNWQSGSNGTKRTWTYGRGLLPRRRGALHNRNARCRNRGRWSRFCGRRPQGQRAAFCQA